MVKKVMLVMVAVSLLGGPAFAAPCRDARGKFTKCPKPAATAVRCKDAKGRYAKCGVPGSHSVS